MNFRVNMSTLIKNSLKYHINDRMPLLSKTFKYSELYLAVTDGIESKLIKYKL